MLRILPTCTGVAFVELEMISGSKFGVANKIFDVSRFHAKELLIGKS